MILVFDVGNTNIVLGIFKEDNLAVDWRIATDRRRTADDLGMLIKNLFDIEGMTFREIEAVVVSSVVPPMTPVLTAMCRRYLKQEPLLIEPGVKTGIPLRYENPREIGADRIVNAVAAYQRYGGKPLIVIDFGTATTFCAISASGEYLGGAIAPGIGISTEALFERASKLPRIELVKPQQVIGKNTVASMQSGIYYGFIGQVDGIVARMKEELGDGTVVVATGGLAELICEGTRSVDHVDPFLTLWGLKLIYERNRG